MFCPKCGQNNADTSTFCVNCGNSLKPAAPPQPPAQPAYPPQAPLSSYTPQTASPQYPPQQPPYPPQAPPPHYTYPPQAPPPPYAPQPPRKNRTGLIVGLVAGGVVLIAAILALILLLPSDPSVAGVWYSDSLGAVLEFRDNGKVYVYTADDEYKGEYEFDRRTAEGILYVEDDEVEFTLKSSKLVFEDGSSFRQADKNFDIAAFLDEMSPTPVPAATSPPPAESEPQESVTLAVETVTDQTMTLSFAFGDRTGSYTGQIVDGLPQGYGTFTTSNSEGTIWYYEGFWEAGHLYGDGTTVWEDGFSEGGWYEDDFLNGEGWESWYGILRYEGGYVDGYYHGQGTYYNYHGEIVYSGTFYYGIIQESAQDRSDRVGAFKDQSVPCTIDELYDACANEISIRAEVTGEIFQVFYYPETDPTSCEIRIYLNGIQDADYVIEINYLLSEGEALPVEGQSVTIWGTTEYLYTYTTYDGVDLTVPQLEAWSVE